MERQEDTKAKQEQRKRFARDLQQTIGRFGVQHGIAMERLTEFRRRVAAKQSLLIERAEPEVLEQAFFRTAAALVKAEETGGPNENAALFHFEEDADLHRCILKLPFEKRNPFLLHVFHGKSAEQIAELDSDPKEKIDWSIRRSREFLMEEMKFENEAQLDQRLRLLGKSYSRLLFEPALEEQPAQSSSEPEAAEEPAEAAVAAAEPPRKEPRSGKRTALWAAAFIAIAGIFGSTFFLNDEPESGASVEEEEEEVITASMIEEWQNSYRTIRAVSPEQLGLQAEQFEQLNYVQQADAAYEEFFSDESLKELSENPEEMERRVAELLIMIETPRGMANNSYMEVLVSSGKTDFIQLFGEKTKELMNIVNELLAAHQEELSSAAGETGLAPELLMNGLDSYPEEIAGVLRQLNMASLRIAVHPEKPLFIARRDMEPLIRLPQLSDEGVLWMYMSVLAEEPFMDSGGWLVPEESLAMQLAYMEAVLLEGDPGQDYYGQVELWFEQGFWLMMKGAPVLGSEGVPEDRQQLWQVLMSYSQDPMFYVMHPIVKEMKESGWRESEHYDRLAYGDVMEAVDKKRSGELAALLPYADFAVENRFVDLSAFDWQETEELYSRFSESHDTAELEGADPLDIFLLYHHANLQDDPVTMWHVLAEDLARPELESYVAGWERLPDITQQVRWLELFEGSEHRIGEGLMVMPNIGFSGGEGEGRVQGPVLVAGEEGIWFLKYQWTERHVLDDSAAAYLEEIRTLYERLSQENDLTVTEDADPSVIGGVFLYAAEQEDARTMKLLLYEPLVSEEVSTEEISAEEMERRLLQFTAEPFDQIEEITFFNSGFYWGDAEVRGSLDISYGNQINSLSMIKTEEGWRMGVSYW